MVNLFFAYELDAWSQDFNTAFFLKMLIQINVLILDMVLDSIFVHFLQTYDNNFIFFGVDNNSLVHTHNLKKGILVLYGGLTYGLDDTSITAEAKYSINFTESGKSLF